MTPRNIRLFALFIACSATPLLAQQGCFHSPEAPTDALMLIGSAGMFFGSGPLMRFLRKRNGK